MGQIVTRWGGNRVADLGTQRNRVADLESQLRRARLDCEEERRAREHLGAMLTSIERELNRMRNQSKDWVIASDEIQIRRDQPLGEGAWGVVYRGKFQGCDVAVKEIHPNIMSDRNRQLFEREVDIASRCRHPCLLQFIGATAGERPLLITEIMECSLRARLYNQTDPPLSDPEITTIALDVAKALNYLHQKREPIIHHDISSGNVLLRPHGDQWRAKVSDYGTANFVRQSNINYAGNAVYCAPESLREDPNKPISCKVGIMERWKGAEFIMHSKLTLISPPPPPPPQQPKTTQTHTHTRTRIKGPPNCYKKMNPIRSPWIKAPT